MKLLKQVKKHDEVNLIFESLPSSDFPIKMKIALTVIKVDHDGTIHFIEAAGTIKPEK